jgi:hypothetical protein
LNECRGVLNSVQIGAADATGFGCHQNLTCAWLGLWNVIDPKPSALHERCFHSVTL